MSEVRRYEFKLYPTAEQDAALRAQCRMVAELWNALLQRREDVWRRERRTLSRFALEYEITTLRRECPEWEQLSTWTARRVNYQLHLAFEAFFRRLRQGEGAQAGYPRYKRTSLHNSIPHRFASGCKLIRRDGRNWQLRLKGVPGPIHARGTFPGTILDWADADVIRRNDRWYVSACVEIDRSRCAGRAPITIRFDGIDGFARVNGELQTPAELDAVLALQEDVDRLRSARDLRWPRRAPDDPDWIEASARIAELSARIARKRRNALHVWTSQIVARASMIAIIAPKISAHVKSPRGTRREWGAAVETVSQLNRHVLGYAPAMAVAMLQYKAAEAGIRCFVVHDEAPEIAVGEKLVAAGKTIRKLKRAMQENDNEHYQQGIGRA